MGRAGDSSINRERQLAHFKVESTHTRDNPGIRQTARRKMESAVQYLVYDEKSFYYAMHSGRKLYTSLISCIFGSNTGAYYTSILPWTALSVPVSSGCCNYPPNSPLPPPPPLPGTERDAKVLSLYSPGSGDKIRGIKSQFAE